MHYTVGITKTFQLDKFCVNSKDTPIKLETLMF